MLGAVRSGADHFRGELAVVTRRIVSGGTPEERWRACRGASGGSDFFHRLGLKPFGALGDLKLDLVAFIERLEAQRGNGRVVDEDIRTLILRDEPKPFLETITKWGLATCILAGHGRQSW
jgi:hypothetical protein